ncbi:MAG: SDR family NAD(P)-dependent oxidoreductase [Actinobacteria bacterium]|nr:SDR family NAD(P)-dependent oxidoreductase [Actinomycetota bacterium]
MVRTVLVTGTNSGVGLETALHLARLGFKVVGTVRSHDKADRLHEAAGEAGVVVENAVLDVTDSGRGEALADELQPGGGEQRRLHEHRPDGRRPPEDALRQLEVMVVAPMRLAALAIPAMRRRGEGRIVNVSSVAATPPRP